MNVQTMRSRKSTQSQMYDLICEAQNHLFEAIRHIEEYVQLSGDTQTERTLLANLQIMASADHRWLARDTNLDDLLQEIVETADEDDE